MKNVSMPVWMYCAVTAVMMYVGGYFGYEMCTKEFVKKLNKYGEEYPDKTMREFAEECSEE